MCDSTLDFVRLDIRELFRAGALAPGTRLTMRSHGELESEDTYELLVGENELTVRRRANETTCRLARTPNHFGGSTTWLSCPGCGRRCRIVYEGGGQWLCRRCRHLIYPSQREDVADRAIRRAKKLRARLGADRSYWAPVERPRGMHRTTFEKLAREIFSAEMFFLEYLERHSNLAGDFEIGQFSTPPSMRLPRPG